jgi:hypothetical protein
MKPNQTPNPRCSPIHLGRAREGDGRCGCQFARAGVRIHASHGIDSPSMYPPVKQNWFQLEITNPVSVLYISCCNL